MVLDKREQIEYLNKYYGFKFPMKTKFIRSDNRIYFTGDFDDKEEITFLCMCSKPSSLGLGNAWYKNSKSISKLINIKELEKETE